MSDNKYILDLASICLPDNDRYMTFATTNTWIEPLSSSNNKRFNCKRCGAPNQIDVCEYCGSAAEE